MTNIHRIASILIVSLAFVSHASADDAAQIVKSAKAATALAVLPNDRGSGSAFCIDPSGLFVTNAHVAKHVGDRERISLVLNSAEAGERRIAAKVIASDEARDLALLQATEGNDFPALPLGDASALYETQQLTVLGFPFGDALAAKKNKNPNVTVNVVRISSLRKSADVVELIQLDSQLNPGNSGGPVIDAGGRVVGIVRGGIVGGGINFAIPVSDLRSFISTPRIVFTSPTISEDKRTQPIDLTIGVVCLDKDAQPLAVQVVLNPGTPNERTTAASSSDGGQFKVRVVPVVNAAPTRLRASMSLADSTIRASLDDQTIKLDGKEFKLSDLSKLERNAGGVLLVARDGTETKGKSLVMENLKASVGGQPMTIDAGKLERIVIYSSDADPTSVPYHIIVKRGEKVLVTQSGELGTSVVSARSSEPTTRPDDVIFARLEIAKEDRERALGKATARLLDVIESRIQAAANKGDLEAVKTMESAKRSIEVDGKLPEGMKDTAIVGALSAYAAEAKQANARLAGAYEQAIRDYTRARKTSEAEAIKAEMAERVASNGAAPTGVAGFIKLGGTNRLPSFLEPNANAYSEGPGLQLNGDNVVRTREGTWLTQDFTLDLIYSYKPGVQEIGVIGFGEGWGKRNAVLLRVHSPGHAGGYIGFTPQGTPEVNLTGMTERGPHLLRIEKKGDAITVSLCINYKGTFTADVTRTVNDIRSSCPFLNAKNTYIFFGRPGLVFQEIRLLKSTPR